MITSIKYYKAQQADSEYQLPNQTTITQSLIHTLQQGPCGLKKLYHVIEELLLYNLRDGGGGRRQLITLAISKLLFASVSKRVFE